MHYARLVLWFGKLLPVDDTGTVIFGPNRLIHANDPEADLKTVEHSGRAIEAGRQDLEKQMAMFGLTYLMPKTGNQTATERAIDSSENNSALLGWALIFQDAVNLALDYTGKYCGHDEGSNGSVVINTSFKDALSDQDYRILIESFNCLKS